MAQASTIEWTDATWNPVVGCRKVGAGCANCYAERMARRLAAMAEADARRGRYPGKKAAYQHVLDNRGRWNGEVYLHYPSVETPLSWAGPRVIFVNSMSDLFHKRVPEDFIRTVFDVMNRCPQHTFQVLTKRPERARQLSSHLRWGQNIWLGTSVENATVTHRVHDLQQTDAKIRFVSVEPLLGPIPKLPIAGIDWVIVGGESGPGARPMAPAWVRQIRDRCYERGVPFFFKQWGGVHKKRAGRVLDGRTWDEMPLLAVTGG
jgi:protein gp37